MALVVRLSTGRGSRSSVDCAFSLRDWVLGKLFGTADGTFVTLVATGFSGGQVL